MSILNRREFLGRANRSAIGLAAGVTVLSNPQSARATPANDRVRIAVAGIHGRGQTHITGFGGMKDVEIAGEFEGDALFRESFEAMRRHLADTGQVELASTPCRLGRLLTFDVEAEKFVEAPDANQLLSQSYRGPFVVPERV